MKFNRQIFRESTQNEIPNTMRQHEVYKGYGDGQDLRIQRGERPLAGR